MARLVVSILIFLFLNLISCKKYFEIQRKPITQRLCWSAAKKWCEKRSGKLASFKDREDSKALKKQLLALQENLESNYWVGARRENLTNGPHEFKWSADQNIVGHIDGYSWADEINDEFDCLYLATYQGVVTFRAGNCSTPSLNWICEYKGGAPNTTATTTTTVPTTTKQTVIGWIIGTTPGLIVLFTVVILVILVIVRVYVKMDNLKQMNQELKLKRKRRMSLSNVITLESSQSAPAPAPTYTPQPIYITTTPQPARQQASIYAHPSIYSPTKVYEDEVGYYYPNQ